MSTHSQDYWAKHEIRTKVDDDIFERLHFMQKELNGTLGRRPTLNDVLRQLMVDAGWIEKRGWPDGT